MKIPSPGRYSTPSGKLQGFGKISDAYNSYKDFDNKVTNSVRDYFKNFIPNWKQGYKERESLANKAFSGDKEAWKQFGEPFKEMAMGATSAPVGGNVFTAPLAKAMGSQRAGELAGPTSSSSLATQTQRALPAATSRARLPEPKPGVGGVEALEKDPNVFWHGSPTGKFGDSNVHVGTKKAAQQALEARIGIPADGKGWTGNKTYGETLLAGQNTLKKLDPKGYNLTGFNVDVPKNDFYLKDHPELAQKAVFGSGDTIPLNAKPDLFPTRIKGDMRNKVTTPMTDGGANRLASRGINRGRYYKNIGEDEGSISAVVPNKDFLERINVAQPPISDIAKEARKYKSAEEFVKAKLNPPEYAMSHRPTEGVRAFDLTEKVDGENMIPKDMYERWYGSRGTKSDLESIDVLKKIKGKPEADVTIYRASPNESFNNGDWVSLSKSYAQQHAQGNNTKVYSKVVKAKDLKWAMDDVNEFGYYPADYKKQLTDIYNQSKPPVSDIAKEARKYKSAEEFVKAQTKVYRGGEKIDNNKIGSFISFTKEKDVANYWKNRRIGGVVETHYLDPSAKIKTVNKNLPYEGERFTEYAKALREGYDGVFLKGTESEVRLGNLDKLKTKSQLTDIYNQATKGGK